MPPIFHNDQPIIEVGINWFDRLRATAQTSPLRRSRLCLHHSPDDPLHEMIICFCRDTIIRPHRHLTKSESFHVIEGELDVLFFDEYGHPERRVAMGPVNSGRTTVYRLDAPSWHSVIVHSPFAIIHEVTNGPFVAEQSDFAAWAPEDGEPLRRFLEQSDAALLAEGR